MMTKGRKIIWGVVVLIVFLAAIGLAFYLGMQHEISVQKNNCRCWDGVNNVCLPQDACE